MHTQRAEVGLKGLLMFLDTAGIAVAKVDLLGFEIAYSRCLADEFTALLKE